MFKCCNNFSDFIGNAEIIFHEIFSQTKLLFFPQKTFPSSNIREDNRKIVQIVIQAENLA